MMKKNVLSLPERMRLNLSDDCWVDGIELVSKALNRIPSEWINRRLYYKRMSDIYRNPFGSPYLQEICDSFTTEQIVICDYKKSYGKDVMFSCVDEFYKATVALYGAEAADVYKVCYNTITLGLSKPSTILV